MALARVAAARLLAQRAAVARPLLVSQARWAHAVAANPAVAGEYSKWDVRNNDRGIDSSYPHVHAKSAQFKDPLGDYEDKQDRRNLNDPIHEDDEIQTMWSLDEQDYTPFRTAWARVFITLGLLYGVYRLAKKFDAPSRNPTAPRVLAQDMKALNLTDN
eukprot:comp9319_c0_seq1/m.4400 comp9319_c0_seq1/g.4400  ORF comp9319_c0_seq1/g.4400 comp9319_c0_seq1/m.4400 type:complete len:159 (-) comp9319_c0_seq1:97-573(-)